MIALLFHSEKKPFAKLSSWNLLPGWQGHLISHYKAIRPKPMAQDYSNNRRIVDQSSNHSLSRLGVVFQYIPNRWLEGKSGDCL